MKTIYLAGGCFWGMEHYLKQLYGVKATEVGFANGHTESPTYEEVYTDTTGFAETVKVTYDDEQMGLEFLLNMFFRAIDPTSMNQQGEDVGTRYRTGIYYTDATELDVIKHVCAEQQQKVARPIVVEIEPLRNFYPASEFHQDYLDKHSDGYCHLPLSLFKEAKEARPSRQ
ncbi:MAG: peptide-methionine (S)-S-oxide reductase MsrA [Bacteroidales bacterium]|nr:peptide-methionine (S)-S-oxide reductase MsrA [Bacteroidales bacterium]